ncbi:hypothetical protein CLM85_13960 [Streptomyces albidoflavus]|nr:hypothetical protein CLM81_08820 [Streptomyces albidoflavus]PBO18788.1 hypothetical protein CLM83_10210 [Streptomyces albidoflavus]PBO23808.1 hypothetical protein CLM85_13960 [Streptomyces albidoflavus]PBO30101.1 hypothetical protein CLM84_10400 [Streptomyces albidoflavus]
MRHAPPELPVTLDMPSKAAGHLRTTELEPAERDDALDQGATVRRGRGPGQRAHALSPRPARPPPLPNGASGLRG